MDSFESQVVPPPVYLIKIKALLPLKMDKSTLILVLLK